MLTVFFFVLLPLFSVYLFFQTFRMAEVANEHEFNCIIYFMPIVNSFVRAFSWIAFCLRSNKKIKQNETRGIENRFSFFQFLAPGTGLGEDGGTVFSLLLR